MIASIIDAAARAAEANAAHNESDYINPEDGLLYCGKCGTKKQVSVSLPIGEGGAPVVRTVACICRCGQEELERQEREDARQRAMRRVSELRELSLMDAHFESQTFENFRETPQNAEILRKCRKYTERFDEMLEKGSGLLFYGDVGTGKTFAAACIANALLSRGVPVVMTSLVKLLEHTQGFDTDEQGLTHRLNEAKLLILDDFGAERGTDYALEKVYNIIDSRYRSELPMILTTNLSLSEMKNVSDRRYKRIYDRVLEYCYPVEFKGQSQRKIGAAKRFIAARELFEEDSHE